MPGRTHAIASADMAAFLEPMRLPAIILSTRASAAAPWAVGPDRDALHPHWLVQSKDQYGRPVAALIDHDVVVGVGGVTLDGEGMEADALTRRLVTLAALNGTTSNRFDTRSLLSLLRSFDWHTRWRLSLGVACNADLGRHHFDEHLRILREAVTVAHVVPIMRRIADLITSMAAETSTAVDGEPLDQGKFDSSQLARRLGITRHSLTKEASLMTAINCGLGGGVCVDPEDGRTKPAKTLSVRRVKNLVLPWRVLADMSQRGLLPHDPLCFSPFDAAEDSIHKVSERNGTGGSVLAIAPPYFLKLVNAAALWVLDYAPVLLSALSSMENHPSLRANRRVNSVSAAANRIALSRSLDGSLPVGMPRLLLSWPEATGGTRYVSDGRMPMSRAIRHLMTACMVIVASLGARSITDVLQLRVGCIARDASGEYLLALHLADDIRDLDAMPVPWIVAQAINVLGELTAGTRAATGDDRLFRFHHRPWTITEGNAGRKGFIAFPCNGYLVDFASANGLPVVDPETGAPLTGDQLRLGFAVAYHHVVPGLPLEALTRALGQFGLPDTEAYVTRVLPGAAARVAELIRSREATHRDAAGQAGVAELRALLRDLQSRRDGFEAARCDEVLRLLGGIVSGSDVPGGPGGERLVLGVQSMVDTARRHVRVLGRNHPEAEKQELQAVFRRYAESHPLKLVPGGYLHCACRTGNPADLAGARCLTPEVGRPAWMDAPPTGDTAEGPDFSRAGIIPCLYCIHGAAFAADRLILDAECARVAGSGGPAETDAAAGARLARLTDLRAARARAAPSGRRVV